MAERVAQTEHSAQETTGGDSSSYSPLHWLGNLRQLLFVSEPQSNLSLVSSATCIFFQFAINCCTLSPSSMSNSVNVFFNTFLKGNKSHGLGPIHESY